MTCTNLCLWLRTVCVQVKDKVPQAKEAEKKITSAPAQAKKADDKVKQAVPQAKEAEKNITSAPAQAKKADDKVKQAVPQAKEAEKNITSAPAQAKKADDKVKQAVPQAKEAEKAITTGQVCICPLCTIRHLQLETTALKPPCNSPLPHGSARCKGW